MPRAARNAFAALAIEGAGSGASAAYAEALAKAHSQAIRQAWRIMVIILSVWLMVRGTVIQRVNSFPEHSGSGFE